MNTLYLTDGSSNICVDTENNTAKYIKSIDRYSVIRDIYYIEEPTHVVYQSGERKEETDVKKGEFLIVFYNDKSNKYILDTVRSKQFATNIKNLYKLEQQYKEEWASANANIGKNDIGCICPECACNNVNTTNDIVTKIKQAKKSKSKKS